MARIIVAGYVIRHPLAGNLLAFFHHVLGLQRLGHEILYLEESICAHRHSTIENCDLLLVLEEGRLINITSDVLSAIN